VPTNGIDASRAILGGHSARETFLVATLCQRLCPPYGTVRLELTVFDRQKVTGWFLVVVSTAFILYFLKVRLLGEGPPLEKKEWVQFIGSIIVLMIGTMNVRLAAMRDERRKR
jgi:hypothetical protein